MSPDGERREDDRITLARPCKVYDARAQKYWLGETANLSSTGSLLTILRPLDLAPGDELFVGIAFTRRQAILRSSEMRRAVVMHVLITADDRSIVGLRFTEAQLDTTAVNAQAA